MRLKFLLNHSIKTILLAYLIAFFIISVHNAFTSHYVLMDTIEHIEASYLISQGLLPYQDFFEHHFPLLWYLLTPIIYLVNKSTSIIYIVRILAIILNILNLYIFYKLVSKFIYNKKVAYYSILSLIAIPGLLKDTINMRPDTPMLTFYLLGLYCFFHFIQNKKDKYLILSYLCMSISLLFLQKVILLLIGFAVINLKLIHKKEITIKQFMTAVSFSLIPIGIFITYLIANNLWADFFYYNFTYNRFVIQYYYTYKSGIHYLLPMLCNITIFFIYLYNLKSIPHQTFFASAIFAFITIKYFAPHPWYYQPYFFFSTPILGKLLSKAPPKVILIFLLFLTNQMYHLYSTKKGLQNYMEAFNYVLNNTPPKAKTLSLATLPTFPYTIPSNYYWFGFHNIVIIDMLTTPKQFTPLEEKIKQDPPYFIYYPQSIMETTLYYHNKWNYYRNSLILKKAHSSPEILKYIAPPTPELIDIDTKWLEKNYQKTPIKGLYKKIPQTNVEG